MHVVRLLLAMEVALAGAAGGREGLGQRVAAQAVAPTSKCDKCH
jgi:hypothetical protein